MSKATTFEDKEVVGVALLGLARVAKAAKQYWRAAHLLGAAEAHLNIRIDLDALAYVAYERDVAALKIYLGEAAYTQAQNQGSRMTPEQVLTRAEPTQTTALSVLPKYPDGLTEREVEVLRLVASGLTDAQVAEQLVISPRTVQGHLRSIYSKIQVNSRSAATRYAVDHHEPPGTDCREHFKSVVTMLRSAFPDLHLHIEDMIADEEKVASRITMTGTHSGPGAFFGIAPSGKRFQIQQMRFVRFANGQMTDSWAVIDMLAWMQQLGAIPARGSGEALIRGR